jgi:hypothetical protein
MIESLDNFYFNQAEPNKSTLLALREIILKYDPAITNNWKYGMPFFSAQGKMFCYLWVHKKFKKPYIGFVDGKLMEHPDLLVEKRVRMKILLIDPNEDLPINLINELIEMALYFSKKRMK